MKQFFSYFKFLFIILGILAVVTGVTGAVQLMSGSYIRKNSGAPSERVYDYADVLSDAEEEKLVKLIEKREKQIGCDIVLVTINESLYEKYGVTEDTDANWEACITRYAEDFYIDNGYGYNLPGEDGDGALLLHNWYPGEKGLHLAHGGRVWDHYSDGMIADVLDEVYYKAKESPYRAYRLYIEDMYREMSGKSSKINLNPFLLFVIAIVSAGIFVGTHIKSKEGQKTTVPSTYVENGSVRFHVQRDELVNKFVTSRVIPQNTSSGGRSGGGGRSSGGSRMGGGSRRG